MSEEQRKAGDYVITNSIHIGKKEILLGVNPKAEDGKTYLVADCEQNDIFESFENCLVSNNYIEIAEIYSQRLTEQIQQMKDYYNSIPEDKTPILIDSCIPLRECEDITNKIVVVRHSVLRPEYQIAQSQIYLAKGGNGTKYNSRGTAVYCDNLYNGKHTRYERYDLIGVLKPECYPEWVKQRVELLEVIKTNPKVFEYGGYHFLPVGKVKDNFETISKNISTDRKFGMWGEKYSEIYGKGGYKREEFYEASRNSMADIFKCLENAKNYIPAENELFEYTGQFKELNDKQKKKSHKEVER